MRMAEKRMFTQKIIDSDAFLDMPLSTQALYFHLNMRADDDGFINNPKRIQRTIGASEDDLKLLIAKRFVICFENGVIVIKHWRMHNTLRKDRYNPTQYQEELAMLQIKPNKSYTEKLPEPDGNHLATNWQPDGNHLATQYSIGEYSIGKCSIGESRELATKNTPTPTTHILGKYKNVFMTEEQLQSLKTEYSDYEQKIERLSEYMASSGKTYENHYATLCLWAKEDAQKKKTKKNGFHNFHQRQYDYGSFEQDAVKRMVEKKQNPPKTAADDESIMERAEALKKQFA